MALTNGGPQGIPEAIIAGFLDAAQHGSPTVDWLAFAAGVFKQIDDFTARLWSSSKTGTSP